MQPLAERQVHEAETAQRITEILAAAYPDCPASWVQAAVAAARERLAAARVRLFVAIFTERFARKTLDESIADRRGGRARRRPAGWLPPASVASPSHVNFAPSAR